MKNSEPPALHEPPVLPPAPDYGNIGRAKTGSLQGDKIRDKKIEDAARTLIKNAMPEIGSEWVHVRMKDAMALRDILEGKDG